MKKASMSNNDFMGLFGNEDEAINKDEEMLCSHRQYDGFSLSSGEEFNPDPNVAISADKQS